MNHLIKYRVLMIVLTILLTAVLGIMAYADKDEMPQKPSSGKIMVSRWCNI